jgi:hypothetical protein
MNPDENTIEQSTTTPVVGEVVHSDKTLDCSIFYTLLESARLLRRSEKSVRRLIDSGRLRRDPTSYRILIPRSDVDNFIRGWNRK